MTERRFVIKFRAKLFIALLFMGYFVILIVQQEFVMRQQQTEILQLENEISEVRQDNEILLHQIEAAESEEYIEKAARERLGWVKEGEIIFIEKKKP